MTKIQKFSTFEFDILKIVSDFVLRASNLSLQNNRMLYFDILWLGQMSNVFTFPLGLR
jgi:hypothetical protein